MKTYQISFLPLFDSIFSLPQHSIVRSAFLCPCMLFRSTAPCNMFECILSVFIIFVLLVPGWKAASTTMRTKRILFILKEMGIPFVLFHCAVANEMKWVVLCVCVCVHIFLKTIFIVIICSFGGARSSFSSFSPLFSPPSHSPSSFHCFLFNSTMRQFSIIIWHTYQTCVCIIYWHCTFYMATDTNSMWKIKISILHTKVPCFFYSSAYVSPSLSLALSLVCLFHFVSGKECTKKMPATTTTKTTHTHIHDRQEKCVEQIQQRYIQISNGSWVLFFLLLFFSHPHSIIRRSHTVRLFCFFLFFNCT